jgi:hypothetical protein
LERGELVAQDKDLDLLGGVGSSAQHDPAQELREHLVDQPQSHQRILSDYMPPANEQVRGCVRSFGHSQVGADGLGGDMTVERVPGALADAGGR